MGVSNAPCLTWDSKEGRKTYCNLILCNYLKPSDNSTVLVFQLPPKPQTLQGYAGKVDRKRLPASTAPKSSTLADTPKLASPRRTSSQKTQRTPQVNDKRILLLAFTLTQLFFFPGFFYCHMVDQHSGMHWMTNHVLRRKEKKGRWLVEQEGEDAERNR